MCKNKKQTNPLKRRIVHTDHVHHAFSDITFQLVFLTVRYSDLFKAEKYYQLIYFLMSENNENII